MAFVYKADRDSSKPEQMPGPGTYIGPAQYVTKPQAAPFNTQVSRGKPLKKDSAPGPGSYNVDFHAEGYQQRQRRQKVVLQSGQSEVKILEIPKPQAIFQSRTKRFPDQKAIDTPGPGAYESEVPVKPNAQQYGSNNVLDQLFKLNRYQSIPSIPSNNQIHGYVEKGNQDLEPNKNPQLAFTGLKQDTVGPGQYQLKDTFEINKQKGPQWCKSKVSRLAAPGPDKSAGPGAYDHDGALIPLYKLNPSSGFLSKSQRVFDQQRGSKARDFMKVQFDTQKKKLLQSPAFADIEDEEIEFIEDATPGPGHYFQNSLSTANTSYSAPKLGQHVFGSKMKRFKENDIINVVGPGDYEVQGNMVRNAMPYKQPPFLSSNTRFESRVLEKKPGPQSYNPLTTLGDKLVKKLERGPLGKFGSNQARFDGKEDEVPGPGYYDQREQEKNQAAANVFKSQTKRQIVAERKDQVPAPGDYDVKNYTIQQATKFELEEDPDLAVKKPAFGVSVPRFAHPQIPEKDDDDDEMERTAPLHNDSVEKQRRQKKDHPPFNIQNKRFTYDNKNPVPGPGEYFDVKANPWDKKTFNILFSEI